MPESIDDIMNRIVAIQARANAINAKRDEALKSSIRTNAVGNFFLPGAPYEGSFVKSVNIPRNYPMENITNAPNTAVILAHGSPSGGYSIDPESPMAPAFRALKEEKAPLKSESEKEFKNWEGWLKTRTTPEFLDDVGNPKSKSNQVVEALKYLDNSIETTGFTIDDFAKAMGTSTNTVKRLVNASCFAAGLTFDEAKKRFPNLEEFISPTLDKPTSANFLKVLGTTNSDVLKSGSYSESDSKFSPFYAISKNKTNLVTGPKDWNPAFSDPTIKTPNPK